MLPDAPIEGAPPARFETRKPTAPAIQKITNARHAPQWGDRGSFTESRLPQVGRTMAPLVLRMAAENRSAERAREIAALGADLPALIGCGMPALWSCPHCGRVFRRPNQAHSCDLGRRCELVAG